MAGKDLIYGKLGHLMGRNNGNAPLWLVTCLTNQYIYQTFTVTVTVTVYCIY